jgi:hypothetical protein
MTELLRAEWQKAHRNRYLFIFTAGIFPLGVLLIMTLYVITLLFDPTLSGGAPVAWWTLMEVGFTVPSMFLGQILLMAFAASIFAGESSWDTWKSIVPRTQRLKLILMKYLLFVLVIFASFNLMALIIILGSMLMGTVSGTGYTPVLFSEAAFALTDNYLLLLLTTMLNMTIAAGYAGIASIFTSSIVGGTIAGVVISIAENASLALFLFLQSLFETTALLYVYQLLPGYNILNIQSWLLNDSGVTPGGSTGDMVPMALSSSLLIVLAWLVFLLTVTIISFYRRDIS